MRIRSFYYWSRLAIPFNLLCVAPLIYGVLAIAAVEMLNG